MTKHKSKRFLLLKKLTTTKSIYSLEEGIHFLKIISMETFLETVEAHIALNINPKYGAHQIRTCVNLPYGNGKIIKVAVLTKSEKVSEVLKLGATIAGSDDLIDKIKKGNINFDILLTSREFMPKLTVLGKILGPRSLMPSLKFGTITEDFKDTINQFQTGKTLYSADKTGVVHLGIGKSHFLENQIKANILALYTSIEKNKPQGLKGKYFKSIYICSTQSPSLRIDLQSIKVKNF